MSSNKCILYSFIIHCVILGLVFVGLPHWSPRVYPENVAISMEILPINSVSNVKPAHAPSVVKEDKKETPPKPQQKPVPKPEPVEDKEPIKNNTTKKENVTEVPPTPAENGPKIEKKDEKKLEQVKPKKDEVKKEQKEKKDKVKDNLDVDALLKNLDEQTSKKPKTKSEVKPKDTLKKEIEDELESELDNLSEGPHDANQPLSLSEKDAIINQIYKCWNVPIGAKNIENTKVAVSVYLQVDGKVQNAKIKNESLLGSDLSYRTLAESALRAVYKCSPIKGLPVNKYDNWKEIELIFNPSDLIY